MPTEKAYRNARSAPTDLDSGRVLGVGEVVLESALNLDDGSHDRALIDDGVLIEAELPQPELAGEELEARARALDIKDRSKLSAGELRAAVAEAEAGGGAPDGEVAT